MNSDRNLEPSLFQFLKQSGPYTDPTYHTDQDNYQALLESKILVIGAGGLGCEILKDLSLTGFKNIHVIDMDTIDISNLNRQFLFRQNDIGKSKAEVAAAFVMERVKGCNITPFFGKIQDMPLEYYKQFNCIIAGLDSVEARRWINATIVNLYEPDDFENTFIPLIDGGTEGFKGQSRVILPKMTACYECSLNLLTTKATYPVCTIANTPRLPEHCIEWALQLEWPRHFGQRKFDSDSSEDVDWIYAKSLERGKFFGINGITRSLTLGVAKNIIPAIASTNAIIAASCCNEAFKIITSCNPILEEYMMYSGSDSIFTYTFQMEKREDCPVCGYAPKTIEIPKWYTLRDFIENKVKSSNEGNNNNIQINKPSLRTNSKNLYLQSPEFLEKTTRPNLDKKLSELIAHSEEIIVTDPNLPISMKIKPVFTTNESIN